MAFSKNCLVISHMLHYGQKANNIRRIAFNFFQLGKDVTFPCLNSNALKRRRVDIKINSDQMRKLVSHGTQKRCISSTACINNALPLIFL